MGYVVESGFSSSERAGLGFVALLPGLFVHFLVYLEIHLYNNK